MKIWTDSPKPMDFTCQIMSKFGKGVFRRIKCKDRENEQTFDGGRLVKSSLCP